MKKFLIMMLMCVFTVSLFAQSDYTRIFCDCHYTPHYGEAFVKSNDTVVYAIPIGVYNDNTSKYFYEFHYNNDKKVASLDSIKAIPDIFSGAKDYTLTYNYARLEKITETFKYGYIDDWSWDTNSVNGIDFEIKYTNTNKKTIKYIDIYFIIKNPVGDICRLRYNNTNVGHLQCVGPIEQFVTAKYSWDAVYYTTGDASNMYFKKFVITYMDGSKYTLVKELAYKYYPYDK